MGGERNKIDGRSWRFSSGQRMEQHHTQLWTTRESREENPTQEDTLTQSRAAQR